MNRESLYLVDQDKDEARERFDLLIEGEKEVPHDLKQKTVYHLANVLNSPEFSHFVSGLFLPFQHLVALMMKIKQLEENEIGELAKRDSLQGLPRYEIAQQLRERFSTGIQKKWGVSLDQGNLVDLKKTCFKIIPQIRDKLGGMLKNLRERPVQTEFQDQLINDGYPLVYSVALGMFDQLEGLILELDKQLDSVEFGLTVLYLPVPLNHHLNDLALIKLIRLHECLQIMLQEIGMNKEIGRVNVWQQVLERAQVYPAYHLQYSSNLRKVEQCWPNFEGGDSTDLKKVLGRIKLDAIQSYVANEREVSEKTPVIHEITVTGKSLASFSNLVPITDLRTFSGVVSAENLSDGIAKLTVSMHRGVIFQRKILNRVDELAELELPEEAELLARIYQLMTNHINFWEHNDAEQHYAQWKKQAAKIADLVQAKKRAETGLKIAGLPAAAPTTAETATTESTSTKTT